jgi:hypothetical protein
MREIRGNQGNAALLVRRGLFTHIYKAFAIMAIGNLEKIVEMLFIGLVMGNPFIP